MIIRQIQLKLFLEEPLWVTPRDFIPVFHRFIQAHALDDLLIDVADYSHVHDGPGVVLVGHEANYSMDQAGGRMGLLYARKRDEPAPAPSALLFALRMAISACRAIEADEALRGEVHFRSDDLFVRVADRLLAPNTPESFAALAADLATFLAGPYAPAVPALSSEGSGKGLLTVRARAAGAPDLATLLSRLPATPARWAASRSVAEGPEQDGEG